MRLRSAFYIAASFGLCAGAAFAQDRGDRFVERDANGDGVLSQREYTSTGGHPGNFRALDINGDGVLSRGEFVGRDGTYEDDAVAAIKTEPAPYYRADDPNVLTKVVFRKLDVNRDNLLTRREWSGDAATFRKLDANSDGFVSSGEYVSAGALVGGVGSAVPADNNFRAKDGNRDGMLSPAEYGEQRTFYRVDRNNDGRISYDEYLNPPPAPGPGSTEYAFLLRDTNRDGMLSRAEYGDGRMFGRVDGNRDGAISYDEFLNAPGGRRGSNQNRSR